MSAAKKRSQFQATFPVWVGSLDASVNEDVLLGAFQHFGKVQSAVVQRDEFGRSKSFGYVNFASVSAAEKAANTMNSKTVAGQKIKTKGPKVLQKEGYFVSGKDYRPFTDCRFFMKRGYCKNERKKLCPYRHNDIARSTTILCKKWQDRDCLDVNCFMLHPGGLGVKRSSGSNEEEGMYYDDDDDDDVQFMSDSDDDDDDDSSESDEEVGDTVMYSHRMSDDQVARMMGLDIDDQPTPGGQSRLRERASSSSSSSDEDSMEEKAMKSKKIQHSKGKIRKNISKSSLSSGLSHFNSSGSEDEIQVVDTGRASKHSKGKSSGGSKGSGKKSAAQLEPVGIFWDIENCVVPPGRSAFHLVQKFRQNFVEGKREVEFMCVCDTLKETGEVITDLNKAHVTVVHVSAVAKNAADDKLRVSLRRFADTYNSPATVVMVTSDVNFSNDLHDLRHRHMFTVILVHNRNASDALKYTAHTTVMFDDFVRDIPTRGEDAAMRLSFGVKVTGFSSALSRYKVRDKLLHLSENCGGFIRDVSDIKSGAARIRFRTYDAAARAQRRIDGANMFGYPLTAVLEQPQQPQGRPQPMSWKVNDHPLLPPPQQLQPHPFQSRPHPPLPPHTNIPNNYNFASTFPPANFNPLNTSNPVLLPQYPKLPPSPMNKAGPPIMPSPPRITAGVPAEMYLPRPKPPPPQPVHVPNSLLGMPPPGAFMTQQHRQPPPPFLPPAHHVPDHDIIIVGGKGRIVINGIKGVKDKTLIPVLFSKLTGEVVKLCMMASVMIDQDLTIYWHNSMEYLIVVTVDLLKTCQVMQVSPSPSDILHNHVASRALLKRSCDVLLGQFRSEQLPWLVRPCTWSQLQEESIQIRSKVIEILKQQEFGWTSWTTLQLQYNMLVKGRMIVADQVNMCCQGAVELQGSNMATMIAILSEMSPNVGVTAEPSIPRRFIRMVKKYPQGVRLLNLVGMYWKEYGPLPIDEASGRKLLDLLLRQRQKGFMVDGNLSDWCSVMTRVVDGSKQSGEPGTELPLYPTLQQLFEEFRTLLLNTSYHSIPLDQFQPSYQKHFKRSFRTSNYGKDKMRDLLAECPHLKLINDTVYLTGSEGSAHVRPSITMATSNLLSSSSSESDADFSELHKSIKQILATTPDGKILLSDLQSRLKADRLVTNVGYTSQLLEECPFLKVEDTKEGKMVAWSEKWLAERKKAFAAECKEILSKSKNNEMDVKKFAEEFCRVFKRQLVCADYGSKKIVNMLESIPDVMVTTVDNQTTIKLTEDESNLPSMSLLKLQLEEYLWSCPDHICTLVKLRPNFESATSYKLDYSAYGYSKLTYMLEAMSDTIKLTGDGPNRLVMLQPLRKFACEVRRVLANYPSGLLFSTFASDFRSCLGYECIVGHYGSYTKLVQVFEGIPDTAKIVGEALARKVHLCHSEITDKTIIEPIQAAAAAAVSMPVKLGPVAWNTLVLLSSSDDHRIRLGDLAGHYNNACSRQLKLNDYGYSSMEKFLLAIPKIQVKEVGAHKYVTSSLPILFTRDAIAVMIWSENYSLKWNEFLFTYEAFTGEPFALKMYGSDLNQMLLSCEPWILTDIDGMNVSLRLPPFATKDEFIEAVNNSNVKLKMVTNDGLAAGKDYRRLISETKRLLLMSPTYSLTLQAIVEYFVDNNDPLCKSVDELRHILATTTHSLIVTDSTSVAVEIEARKKKLSKDLLYLFNECNVWKLSLLELADWYEQCFLQPLEAHLYGCNSVAELVKCKHINQILELDGTGNCCVLTYAGKLNILAAQMAEMVFTYRNQWVLIDCVDTYQRYFGTTLELSRLGLCSIEELLNKPTFKMIVGNDGGVLKLKSPALFTESLRHLLTLYDGKLQLDQLPDLFKQSFGQQGLIAEDTKIQEWLTKGSVLSVASQVVHLNNNQWIVWAPGAYKYPRRHNIQTISQHLPVSDKGRFAGSHVVTLPSAVNDYSHILHGNQVTMDSSSSSKLPITLSPSPGKKAGSGRMKMAIKFPSPRAKDDLPPALIDSDEEH